MIEPDTAPQNIRFAHAALHQYATLCAEADTAGLRARVARLERDRYALLAALDVAIALYDEAEAERGSDV